MDAPALPSQMSEVDAAWLSRALDVTVRSVQRAGATGGIPMTSTVARLRLELEEPGAGPTSVVVKLASPRWEHGPEPHEREVRFYRDFAPKHALPVPRCYYADYDRATGHFVLVLDDLGDLVPGHRLDGLDEDEARAVLDGSFALTSPRRFATNSSAASRGTRPSRHGLRARPAPCRGTGNACAQRWWPARRLLRDRCSRTPQPHTPGQDTRGALA